MTVQYTVCRHFYVNKMTSLPSTNRIDMWERFKEGQACTVYKENTLGTLVCILTFVVMFLYYKVCTKCKTVQVMQAFVL